MLDLLLEKKLAMCIFLRLIALPIGRHYKLRESASVSVPRNDTLEKLFKQHRKIYPSDNVILVLILLLTSLQKFAHRAFVFCWWVQ